MIRDLINNAESIKALRKYCEEHFTKIANAFSVHNDWQSKAEKEINRLIGALANANAKINTLANKVDYLERRLTSAEIELMAERNTKNSPSEVMKDAD